MSLVEMSIHNVEKVTFEDIRTLGENPVYAVDLVIKTRDGEQTITLFSAHPLVMQYTTEPD